jgi:hypothetical protein
MVTLTRKRDRNVESLAEVKAILDIAKKQRKVIVHTKQVGAPTVPSAVI